MPARTTRSAVATSEQGERAAQRHAVRLRRSATSERAQGEQQSPGTTHGRPEDDARLAGGEREGRERAAGRCRPLARRRERVRRARGDLRGDEQQVAVAEDGEVQVGGEVGVADRHHAGPSRPSGAATRTSAPTGSGPARSTLGRKVRGAAPGRAARRRPRWSRRSRARYSPLDAGSSLRAAASAPRGSRALGDRRCSGRAPRSPRPPAPTGRRRRRASPARPPRRRRSRTIPKRSSSVATERGPPGSASTSSRPPPRT